jgi:ssDNA-binding Zn-finger/Zn-ribbon topoisomerase 1
LGLSLFFKCCNAKPNVLFKYEIFKPEYKYLAYYECPNCGKRWFEELREKDDKPKYFYDNVAKNKYLAWKKRLENIKQGTNANQSFYYGTYQKHKDVWKTYRTNFNNEKELISKQKTMIHHN